MYASAFVLGFHGCDQEIGEGIIAGSESIRVSTNSHDWLGEGAYFWENSPRRALDWAKKMRDHPSWFRGRVRHPFVVGAIIDLGNCLDLTEASSLSVVRAGFYGMRRVFKAAAISMPENGKGFPDDQDHIKRHLDCAVINYLHASRKRAKQEGFDTVRGAFFEGRPLFAGAGFKAQTHIQIAVRDPKKSVRGFFRPAAGHRGGKLG